MSYFKPDNKKILKLIRELTLEKPHTDQNEVCQKIPQRWKLAGCGTGNVQNTLVDLYRKKLIATATFDPLFYEGTYTNNKLFHLTDKGEQELKAWYQKRKFWIFIFLGITALATMGSFLFLFFR